jgi:hypothetical protein
LGAISVNFTHADFFSEDWKTRFRALAGQEKHRILVLGNPPWVTNSALSQMGGSNLPPKANFQRLRGLDALTGKSNFDIAEWMLIQLIEALPQTGFLAMLCKTSTARKVLKHVWKTRGGLENSRLFRIDAAAAFGVAVDACLFTTTAKQTTERTAVIFDSLSMHSQSRKFGFVGGDLVSDLDAYHRYRHLDGGSVNYTWRSGVKHDAASIMEFQRAGSLFRNGLGEEVSLEETFVYPLLKSSDIGNGRTEARKFVLIPQSATGDDTSRIRTTAPRTWEYLTRHAEAFNKRGSSIYKNRPPFSIFGIGEYSFAPWKIAISGLYKTFTFVLVPPKDGRPVMLDDTCYALSCKTEEEARLLYELLSSKPAREFLRSLVFADAKRPVTVDILRRLSFSELAHEIGQYDKLKNLLQPSDSEKEQTFFLMEDA